MASTICRDFKLYLKDANNIFDIMAASYKLLYPVEPNQALIQDNDLKEMIIQYEKNNYTINAFTVLKKALTNWISKINKIDELQIRKRLFFLVRIIDIRCVPCAYSHLPNLYRHFYALNDLLQNEVIIVPRPKNTAMDLLSDAIAKKEGHNFYGRNQSNTDDISGYIHNFIIYAKTSKVKPRMHVPWYYKKLRNEFEQKNHKLVVAIFPLSNINFYELFNVYEEINETNGTFGIKSPIAAQEDHLLERCKKALELCRDYGVDIAVFPEMLFTDRNQKEIIDYVRKNENSKKRFPWFTWLGTAWSQRENKCLVIDQYGNEVFMQKKNVPYEYKREMSQTITEITAAEYGETDKRVTFKEDLSQNSERNSKRNSERNSEQNSEWVVNFIDIPEVIRIATAICRDISDDLLKAALKKLYSNMIILPAYSNTERLNRHIKFLAADQINVLVCNSCSANCKKGQQKYQINTDLMGKEHPFCYLCMTSKQLNDNAAKFHQARYTQECLHCDERCNGFIWEISFAECTTQQNNYSAKVSCLNF